MLSFFLQKFLLASAGDDSHIRIWDLQNNRCTKILINHSNRVWSLAFSADEAFLVSGSDDRTICVWDVDSGSLVTILGKRKHLLIQLTALG